MHGRANELARLVIKSDWKSLKVLRASAWKNKNNGGSKWKPFYSTKSVSNFWG